MKEFRAHETARLHQLDGVELADFQQRALAFALDALLSFLFMFVLLILAAVAMTGWYALRGWGKFGGIHLKGDTEADKLLLELLMLVLYFGLSTWLGKGRTPGKRIFGIRVVSIVHQHLSLWHSVERSLGYAAAALEFGFGFLQFFIHPYRRTVQDRIAETIVVKEKSYQQKLHPTPTVVDGLAPDEVSASETETVTQAPFSPVDAR